jgi:hypothetical protein
MKAGLPAQFVDQLKASNGECDAALRILMLYNLQVIVRDGAGPLIWACPDKFLARNDSVAHDEGASERPADGYQGFTRWWSAS